MTILALDTSSRAASCALMRDGVLVGEFFANIGLTHSQTAMPMVAQLLAGTNLAITDIDAFAVSTGPGSFTGLRIGIAAVKGMAMASGKPCVGVSTLMALAAGGCLHRGYICPVMDARRGQVYTALFESDGKTLTRRWEDAALSLEDLSDKLDEISSPILLVGDGAVVGIKALGQKENLYLAPERFLHQRAGAIASIANDIYHSGGLVSPAQLAPSYLRLPQAERERQLKTERWK